MRRYYPLLVLLPLLQACDKGPDLAKLCTDNPEICGEFTEDNWCKKERKDAAFAKYHLKQSGKDKQKVDLLFAYEDYAKCVNHASKIEHIKLKEKQRKRVDNYLKAKALISDLSEQTKDSEHPELLYYHWSRYLDESALNKFLALEGSEQMETSQTQFNLATYYVKKDLDKTLELLFRALELHEAETPINIEIFKTLTTIYADKQQYKQAYVWLKILNLYAPEDETINSTSLKQYVTGYDLDGEFLDAVAESTLVKIEAGNFVSPRR